MFCKDCGKEISDNSRFCSYCGGLQKFPQPSAIPQQAVSPQTVQKLEGVFGINISKPIVGIYLMWFLLHLILLLTNWKANNYASKHFFPFGKHADLEDYDLTEFLLFTIVPLVILIIANLFREQKASQIESLQSQYDLTYEKDGAPTIVGVMIIIVSLVFLFANGNGENTTADEESIKQTGAIVSLVSLLLRIGITVWVVDIAKKLNRDTTGWGFLAFFLPSIALIIIGQKKKYKTHGGEQ